MENKVITRIAPSPTGLFHIGTARTALFNYLFAKKNKGKFILRIEDTDPKRSKKEFEDDIIDGLKWLGLKWDDKIFHQSERKSIYQKYSDQLLKSGMAYKKDGAIWFRIDSYPKETIKYRDLIMGDLEFKKENFHDFVIIKSDGIPLYMFAATVDDYDMGITHVIRGADHVNSTPQQIMLYESLNFSLPQFAHIPLILNKDRSKMSKRRDPVSVTRDFRDRGYLPQAMINYMALLGWNPKDNREFFTLVELITKFDLKNVNKSAAIFDVEKLNYFNNHYIQILPNKELVKLISNFPIRQAQGRQFPISKNIDGNLIDKIISVVKPRMNKLEDFEKLAHYFFKLPEYKPELLIFKKSTKESTLKGLKVASNRLSAIDKSDWAGIDKLNQVLLEVVKKENLTNGDVFWPVRAALSGQQKSPSPTELLWVLGKDASLKRINQAIKKL